MRGFDMSGQMQMRERERERRFKTSKSNSSFKLHAVFLKTMKKERFIGMRTDGVEVIVAADDRVRKGEERKEGREERERENGERGCSPTGAGCISSRTNSLPLGVSCWSIKSMATSPSRDFSFLGLSLFSLFPIFPFSLFHTLYAQTFFFLATHNRIVIVIDHVSSIV